MSILTHLREIKELPTLPEVMIKVQKIVNLEKSDAAMLSEIIRQDPSLSSTILKTANSTYYNASNRRISSLVQAITRIGFDEVLKITLAISAIEQFSNTKTIIGYKSFWRHSLAAAGLAQLIVSMSKSESISDDYQDFFLAGLLHDIGILIYDQFFHSEFGKIIDYALKEDKSYLDAENEISPKETHAFIGGALLEIWKLALPIIGAVRYHHTPEKCPQKLGGIVAVIALTEYILSSSYFGSFEGSSCEINESVWTNAGISPDTKNILYAKAEMESNKAEIILSSNPRYNKIGDISWQNDPDHSMLRTI
ncbi:MAG: HDOD domain-containing protein [Chitinispirillia bacterium]